MISPIYQSGKKVYGVNNYVIDTVDDVANLPVYCAMGSTARVISTGDCYIINSDKQWVKQSSGSGGSSSSSDDGDIVVIDATGGDDTQDNITIL